MLKKVVTASKLRDLRGTFPDFCIDSLWEITYPTTPALRPVPVSAIISTPSVLALPCSPVAAHHRPTDALSMCDSIAT